MESSSIALLMFLNDPPVLKGAFIDAFLSECLKKKRIAIEKFKCVYQCMKTKAGC